MFGRNKRDTRLEWHRNQIALLDERIVVLENRTRSLVLALQSTDIIVDGVWPDSYDGKGSTKEMALSLALLLEHLGVALYVVDEHYELREREVAVGA